jgi:hypothetical protein
MKMRGKPDLSGIATPKKDPTAFLDGGAGDIADKSAVVSKPVIVNDEPPVPTVQKLFRLRWDVAKALKAKAAEQSGPGHRVTETEIVENLLKEYFSIDDR